MTNPPAHPRGGTSTSLWTPVLFLVLGIGLVGYNLFVFVGFPLLGDGCTLDGTTLECQLDAGSTSFEYTFNVLINGAVLLFGVFAAAIGIRGIAAYRAERRRGS